MQIKPILVFSMLAAIALGSGCSKSEQSGSRRESPASTNSGAVPGQVAEGAGERLLTDPQVTNKLEKLAARLGDALGDQDLPGFKACFNQDALLEEVLLGVKGSGKNFDAFKKGLRVGLNRTLGTLGETWGSQQIKYKGLVVTLGRPALRFRFISEESAIAFVDFLTGPDARGDYAVINVYNQSVGFDMAAQVRQAALPFLAGLDKNVIQRLLDKPQLKSSEIEQFGELSRNYAQGNYQACVEQFPRLAAPLKNTLSAHVMYIGALQKTEDMDEYRRALKAAAAQFKETSFEFMLVDVYFLEEKYDKALECLDNFSRTVGPDAALLTLKSSTLLAGGKGAQAKESLLEAMALEPDCEFVHSRGLDVLLAQQDYKAVRDSMLLLEKNAGYEFKGNLTDDVWKDFLKAPESKPWR